MLPNELIEQVKALDDDEKLRLLQILIEDPALSKHAYDPFGLRGNFQAAEILMNMHEEKSGAAEPLPS